MSRVFPQILMRCAVVPLLVVLSLATTSDSVAAEPDAIRPALAEAIAERDDGSRDWRTEARIVVHAGPEGERLAGIVAGLFEELGALDVERRAVEAGTRDDQVRWFHAGDEGMARDIAVVLESVFGPVRAIDLTGYEPSPASGLIEIWLR